MWFLLRAKKPLEIFFLRFCYFTMSFSIPGDIRTEERRTLEERYDASSVFLDTTLPAVFSLRFSSEICDVLLCTDDEVRFPFYKAILCSCSEYFRALFCGLLTERFGGRPSRNVVLRGASCSAVAAMLHFIYTGTLDVITVNEAESLLYLADQLIVPSVAKACERFLISRLETQNCIYLYNISKNCYCPYLQQNVRAFILQHLVPRIQHCNKDFFDLSAEDLYSFLKDDDLNVRNEEQVMNLIIDWIEDDQDSRKCYLLPLLKTVRLGLCRSRSLLTIIHNNDLIRENHSVVDQLEHTAVLLLDRKRYKIKIPKTEMHLFRQRSPSALLFLIGGWVRHGVTSRMDIFNPKGGKWISSAFNDSTNPSAYHGVVCLDRFIYTLGGYSDNEILSTVRRFDIDKRLWSSVASMHSPRCYGAFAATSSIILAAGGYDGRSRCRKCELFDPSSNTWTTIAPMTEKRSDAAAANYRENFFVAGGYNGFKVLSSVEMYRSTEDYWCDVTPMMNPRSGFRLLQDSYGLLALGGFNGFKRLRGVERFDVDTGFWFIVSKMKIPRSNFAAVILEDDIYVIGGYQTGNTTERSVETISLKCCRGPKRSYKTWRSVSNLQGGRSALGACVVTRPGLAAFICEGSSEENAV